MQQPLQFDVQPDVCRSRHKGNENSEAANSRVHEHKSLVCERIRVFVASQGFQGATLKETAQTLQHPAQKRPYHPNEISGRFTALKSAGVLFDSGRVRNGCAVYVSEKRWVNP